MSPFTLTPLNLVVAGSLFFGALFVGLNICRLPLLGGLDGDDSEGEIISVISLLLGLLLLGVGHSFSFREVLRAATDGTIVGLSSAPFLTLVLRRRATIRQTRQLASGFPVSEPRVGWGLMWRVAIAPAGACLAFGLVNLWPRFGALWLLYRLLIFVGVPLVYVLFMMAAEALSKNTIGGYLFLLVSTSVALNVLFWLLWGRHWWLVAIAVVLPCTALVFWSEANTYRRGDYAPAILTKLVKSLGLIGTGVLFRIGSEREFEFKRSQDPSIDGRPSDTDVNFDSPFAFVYSARRRLSELQGSNGARWMLTEAAAIRRTGQSFLHAVDERTMRRRRVFTFLVLAGLAVWSHFLHGISAMLKTLPCLLDTHPIWTVALVAVILLVFWNWTTLSISTRGLRAKFLDLEQETLRLEVLAPALLTAGSHPGATIDPGEGPSITVHAWLAGSPNEPLRTGQTSELCVAVGWSELHRPAVTPSGSTELLVEVESSHCSVSPPQRVLFLRTHRSAEEVRFLVTARAASSNVNALFSIVVSRDRRLVNALDIYVPVVATAPQHHAVV